MTTCPWCDQPLPATCAHCGLGRKDWPDPARASKYCSPTHANTARQRRKYARIKEAQK